MNAKETLDEAVSIIKKDSLTKSDAARFGVLLAGAPVEIEYQMGDLASAFIKKASRQPDAEELVALANAAIDEA